LGHPDGDDPGSVGHGIAERLRPRQRWWQVQVRPLNITQSHTLDLSVNNTTINSKVAQGQVGSYGGVDSNNTATQILTSDVGNSVAALTPTLAGGNNYTLIAYGSGATRVSQLQESQDAPDSGKAKVLALNLAPTPARWTSTSPRPTPR
jgi:hypothetical protein